jgi:hypothetical protein
VRGKTVNLLDVEDGLVFQEGNFALNLAGFSLLGAGDLVGVDGKRAFLAFADMGIELESLFERHPKWRAVTGLDRGALEHEYIDAGVRRAVVTERQGDPAGGVADSPGLMPRTNSLLE